MVDEVDLDQGLDDIVEMEILEVVVRWNIQLFQEIILELKVVPKIISPTKRLV